MRTPLRWEHGLAARHRNNRIFVGLGIGAISLCLLVLMTLIITLAIEGLPRLSWDFFTHFPSRFAERAGILGAWVGSTLVLIVTALIVVPLGVAAGVYLEEYAPKNWVTNSIEINVTNLAAVPSIVYGLLALGLFVQTFGFGRSILTAGLTLSLLTLPVIIVATREAIRAIPQSIRDASYALGATQWQTTWNHVIPYATPGILTGLIIGLARAIGETAPLITVGALTFIAFLPSAPISSEFPYISFDWLSDPFTVMPIQIFNWVSRPDPAFATNAAAAALVLLVMTLAMNALAIYLRIRLRRRIRW